MNDTIKFDLSGYGDSVTTNRKLGTIDKSIEVASIEVLETRKPYWMVIDR